MLQNFCEDLLEQPLKLMAAFEVPRPSPDRASIDSGHSEVSLFVQDVQQELPLRPDARVRGSEFA